MSKIFWKNQMSVRNNRKGVFPYEDTASEKKTRK